MDSKQHSADPAAVQELSTSSDASSGMTVAPLAWISDASAASIGDGSEGSGSSNAKADDASSGAVAKRCAGAVVDGDCRGNGRGAGGLSLCRPHRSGSQGLPLTFQVRNTFLEVCNLGADPEDEDDDEGRDKESSNRRGRDDFNGASDGGGGFGHPGPTPPRRSRARARAGSEPPSSTPKQRVLEYVCGGGGEEAAPAAVGSGSAALGASSGDASEEHEAVPTDDPADACCARPLANLGQGYNSADSEDPDAISPCAKHFQDGGALGIGETPSPQQRDLAARACSTSNELQVLRHEVEVAERFADAMQQRRSSLDAECFAWRAAGTDADMEQLQLEEQELREKLHAAEQDLEDTRHARRAAEQRREEVLGTFRGEVEVRRAEVRRVEEECATLQKEMDDERRCAKEVQALGQVSAGSGSQSAGDGGGGASSTGASAAAAALNGRASVAAQSAHTEAMLKLAEARHAAATAAKLRSDAQQTLKDLRHRAAEERRRAQEEEASIASNAADAKACGASDLATAQRRSDEALRRRDDAQSRVAVWQRLAETQRGRADAVSAKVAKVKQRVAEGEDRVTTLQGHLRALAPSLLSSQSSIQAVCRDIASVQRRRLAAVPLVILALVFFMSKLPGFLR